MPQRKRKVWPFRTDPMRTIDLAMDIQHTQNDIAYLNNMYYRLQLLIMLLTAFMIIVFNSYGILDLLYNASKKFQVSRDEGIFLLAYEILVNISNVLGVVVVCGKLKASVKRTGNMVHKVMIVSRDPAIRERMMQFSMQLKRNMPSYTAFEMFEIDATLVYGIVGATTTYLIILVQYSINNPEVSQVEPHYHHHINHSLHHNFSSFH